MYFLKEMVDLQPEFAVMRSIVRETNPLHIITMGITCDDFIKCLIDTINDEEVTVESDSIRKLPSNVSLLPQSEYCELQKLF